MSSSPARAWSRLIATLVLAAALAACGGASTGPAGGPAAQAPAPTAAPVQGPEERIKGFFADFSAAMSDPAIGEEARKAEWVAKLAAYAAPAEQGQARTELEAMLAEFTGLNVGEIVGQPDLNVRMEMLFEITETRLVEERGDSATVELIGGTVSMRPVGADIEKLGAAAAQLTQELPLSEFFGDSDASERQLKLTRVDGVWYILDILGSQ